LPTHSLTLALSLGQYLADSLPLAYPSFGNSQWLAFYLYLFLFFYKAFLFICVCKIYARGYKIICCQDKAGLRLRLGQLLLDQQSTRILWANANYLAQLKIAQVNTHTHTQTHTHRDIAKQLQSLSLLLKSFVLFSVCIFQCQADSQLSTDNRPGDPCN